MDRRHQEFINEQAMEEIERIEREALGVAQHEQETSTHFIGDFDPRDALEKSQQMAVIRADALQKVHELLDHLATSPEWVEAVAEMRAILPERL